MAPSRRHTFRSSQSATARRASVEAAAMTAVAWSSMATGLWSRAGAATSIDVILRGGTDKDLPVPLAPKSRATTRSTQNDGASQALKRRRGVPAHPQRRSCQLLRSPASRRPGASERSSWPRRPGRVPPLAQRANLRAAGRPPFQHPCRGGPDRITPHPSRRLRGDEGGPRAGRSGYRPPGSPPLEWPSRFGRRGARRIARFGPGVARGQGLHREGPPSPVGSDPGA